MTGSTGVTGSTGSTFIMTGPTGPTGQFVTGNELIVDGVNGNDTNAALSPYTTSFKTIGAAISYITGNNLTKQTVFIYPNTYYESVTIPPTCSIRGASTLTTIINPTGPTGASQSIVTMGTQTRLEDVTLNMSSATGSTNLYGVVFGNGASNTGTTTSSKIRTVNINVSYTGTGTTGPQVCGVYVSDTVTPTAYSPYDALRNVTITATTTNTIEGSGPSGACRGIYAVGTSRFAIRDTAILASGPTGTANCIGCEVANTGSFVTLKSGSVGGSLFDVKQADYGGPSGPTGSLILMATDMINQNADANGFLVGVNPNTLICWWTTGTVGPVYLTTSGTASTTANGIVFNQRTTIVGLSMAHTGVMTVGNITVSLYNTTTPTSGASGTLIGTFRIPPSYTANTLLRFLNFSNVIDPTVSPPQYLQIRATSASGYTPGVLQVSIGTY
jgi:hypothetical protein